jgi:ABC-type transport system involved in cytochrome c biogenesis permease subunit
VWLLGLAYLYVELTTDERAMGSFVTVLLAALAVLPALNPQVEQRPALLRSPLFTVHVLSMLFAYASFALAFVLGITYVLLFKEIKAKHLGFFYQRLPSLQTLDVMNARAIVVGWLFLTCGLVVGGIWATQIGGSTDPRAQAMSIGDPKILVAILSWGMYSFALFARKVIGWSGHRAAYMSAIGFIIVLLNFVPVGYFLTRSHNF